MNKNLYFKLLSVFPLLLFAICSHSQNYERIEYSCEDSVKFQIELTVSEGSYKKIRTSTGRKLSFSNVQLQCHGKDHPVKSMKLHGKTSLYFPKKSFSVKLKDQLCIPVENDSICLKEFYLLSLSMDQNYIVNYTAYSLLKSLGIFNLSFQYCEVLINGETQGIYLVTERPRDYAFDRLESPVLIRRGFNHEIDGIDLNKKENVTDSKYFKKKYLQIYTLCHKYSGKQLYDSLNTYIDLSQYMQWLGFNYLVRNGDYTDELFLYYDTSQDRFRIIPWDYDDLFVRYPHEGGEARRTVKGGQFIFSSEDDLDQTIINDKFLYSKYLEQLKYLTDRLSDEFIAEIFQNTYNEVCPYYNDTKILESTEFDKYGLTTKEELFKSIQDKLITILSMKKVVLLELKNTENSIVR